MNTHTSQVMNPLGSNPTALQHRKVLADDGHVSLVEISEGTLDRFAFELSGNQPAHVTSLLNRSLSHARQGPSAFDSGPPRHPRRKRRWRPAPQERIDRESSCSISRDTERLYDRRCRDAGRPQDRRARDPLSSGDDALLVDFLDLHSSQNLDAEFLKPSGGFPGQ